MTQPSPTENVRPASATAVYKGWVRHRRFEPVKHALRYPLFMLYLNLDELESVFSKKWFCSLEKWNWVSFRRQDYFQGRHDDLKQSVIDEVEQHYQEWGLDRPAIVKVCLLGHVRYAGWVFNPVVFYYCFDQDDQLLAVLAEITNTPWGERHHYVLPVEGFDPNQGSAAALKGGRHDMTITSKGGQSDGSNVRHFDFIKQFHVSPFNPMEMTYHWVFTAPEDMLRVHMDNHLMHEGVTDNDQLQKHFDATLVMERKSFSKKFASVLIRQPLITVKVVWGIYWNAFKLWVKRSPFYDHPKLNQEITPSSVKRTSS